MDILAELDTLKSDYTAAQALLNEAQAAKSLFDTQLADKESALTAALDTVSAKDKAIAGKDTEINELKALVESLKKAEVSAEAKAVDIVAAQGIAPVKIEIQPEAKPATRAEVLAHWQGLTNSTDRAAYYVANKVIINGR